MILQANSLEGKGMADPSSERVLTFASSDFVLIALVLAVVYLLARRTFHQAPSPAAAESTRKSS